MEPHSHPNNSRPAPQEALTDEVAQLRAEIRVLRESIDEFREVVEWGVQNGRFGSNEQSEMTDLQFPARPTKDRINDGELNMPTDSIAAESGSTMLSEAARHDVERLNYLIRVMPSRDGFDKEPDYFRNLKLFFEAHQMELAYLNRQVGNGQPCEVAQKIYWKNIYDKQMELRKFEKAQEENLRQQEDEARGVFYTYSGMGQLTEVIKPTSDPARECEGERPSVPRSHTQFDTFYPWGF